MLCSRICLVIAALQLCGEVHASRNRVRLPRDALTASVGSFSNSSLVDSSSYTTTTSGLLPSSSSPSLVASSLSTPATLIAPPVTPAGAPVTPAATPVIPVDSPVTPVQSASATSIASPVSGPVVTPPGSNDTYPTLTVVSVSSLFYGTGTGNIIGTGVTPAWPSYTPSSNGSNSSNGTCGCTVNVRGAAVERWFGYDFNYQLYTLVPVTSGTSVSYSVVTATSTFDLAKTVQQNYVTYVLTSAWDPASNTSTITFEGSELPTPAASSTVMSRSMYLPLPESTQYTDSLALESLYTELPPASVAVTGPSSTIFVASSGTPFVSYSVYEVEKSEPITDVNGHVLCRSSTETYTLPEPYAFEYSGDIPDLAIEATGSIPADFMRTIPQSSCVAGTYQGSVTIIFIVDIIYGSPETPFIGHVESSLGQLEAPEPTYDNPSSTTRPKAHVESSTEPVPPSDYSSSPQGTLTFHTRNYDNLFAHIESAVSELHLPTVMLVNTKASVAANDRPGPDATTAAGPTRMTQDANPSENSNPGGAAPGLGPIISAIASAAATQQAGGGGSGGSSNSGSGGSSPGSGSPNGASSPQNGGPGGQPPVIVAGSQTATMDSSSAFVFSGQTLSPGGPAVIVAGTTLSLAPAATAVTVNGQTVSLSGAQPETEQGPAEPGKPPVITVGSVAYTANAATQYYLGPGQTLTAGGVATVGGTIVSLGPSASYVVVAGATQTFPSALITPAPNPSFVGGAPAFVIGGATLTPGGSIVVSGTTISLDSGANNLVVNGVTKPVGSGAGLVGQPFITVAGSTYPAADGTSFVIGNQVLTPGGAVVVAGTTISLDSSDRTVYINGVPSALQSSYPFSTALPVLTIGGNTIVPQSVGTQNGYWIGGQVLTPGGSVTVDGTVISLAPGATAIVVNGVTELLNPQVATNAGELVIEGATLSGLLGPGSTYVLAGQTLTPGGVIIVDGTTVSLAPDATAVVINGVTQTLVHPAMITNAPILTIDGKTYTDEPGPGTEYIINGQTLTPGGVVVIDGTTISLSPSATALVVNGITQTLFPATATPAPTGFPILTIGGKTYTAINGGTYVIDGKTLTPGGYIVENGTTISLGSSATVLVVDGRTTTLVPASTTGAAAAAESRSAGSGTATRTGGAADATASHASSGSAKMMPRADFSIFLSGLLALIGVCAL